jgi:rhomboid protease GluP
MISGRLSQGRPPTLDIHKSEPIFCPMKVKLAKTLLSKKTTNESVLLGLTSFIFLLLLFWANEMGFLPINDLMVASGVSVFQKHEYWRLFTSTLIHGDLTHLGHNALFFTGFSILLFNYFGWFVFPILSLLVGGLINFLTLKYYPPEVTLVGISGVIYFMASFWMTLFVLLERKESIGRRLMVVSGLSLIFFFPEVFDLRTSYMAHALGFFLGIPLAAIYFLVKKKFFRSEEIWAVEMEPQDLIYREEEFWDEAMVERYDASAESSQRP